MEFLFYLFCFTNISAYYMYNYNYNIFTNMICCVDVRDLKWIYFISGINHSDVDSIKEKKT